MATVTVANAEHALGATRTTPVSGSASIRPNPWLVFGSTAGVIAVAIVMWLAYRYWLRPAPIRLMRSYVPYAGVIAVTAALERLLEPLSQFLPPRKDSAKDAAVASATQARALGADASVPTAQVQRQVDDAAQKQAEADKLRTERTIVFWAIASALGLIISGAFGLFLLQSIAISHVNSFLDLLVTGLTIGAGTKPLHDLITSMQKAGSA